MICKVRLLGFFLLLMCFLFVENNVDASVPDITLNNGTKMPQLGFGTWPLKGRTATKSVRTAIQNGYRLIDTAQIYENEAAVYKGIIESGIDRKEIFITTKISPYSMQEHTVREYLDKSIEALGGEYIDLVLIHGPIQNEIKQTWEILEEYVEQGKIRSIGISNFKQKHIDSLLEYAKIKPVINQIEINPYNIQQDLTDYSFKKNIQVEAWSPLASGKILKNKKLIELAKKYHKSPAQIILRWDIQKGIITIPRSNNPKYIAENINIFDFELSEEDMSIINELSNYKWTNPIVHRFPWN